MNKLSRLAALLLALMLLLCGVASAETGSDGIAIEDLDTATYRSLLSDAQAASAASLCDGESCGYDAYMALDDGLDTAAGDVIQYKYLMGMYDDEGTALEAFLLHVWAEHMYWWLDEEKPEDICGCGVPLAAPGAANHDESCAWANQTVDIALHYDAYKNTDMTSKAFYLLGLDQTQLAAMQALMTDASEKEEMEFLATEGVPDWLKTDAIKAWLADTSVAPTTQMLKAGYEVDTQLKNSGADFAWNEASRLVGSELIDVYTGEVIADYNAETNALTDRKTGLLVGYLETDGTIVGPTTD